MSAFGAVALLSIRPTIRYQRWRSAAALDAAWLAPADEVEATRRALVLQLVLFPLIPACTALMARGFGS